MPDKELLERVARYRSLTETALKKIRLKEGLTAKEKATAGDFLAMARDYARDAGYFDGKGEHLTALAAYSYAHAWLDAGVRAGWLDAQGDDRLFTLP
ncbi:MAG TPA: DUF357 domain-containing protein [Candidatus Diapherotrites archaeon]|uniref:DUF357 domain-containing protein n=1 Tax=Candidatus Iainarchaeum sp. TaxID=3101447 RepID=A0A7J4JFR1_9ARCH|nr:DUF357 domain-containing protein [Candidatus Diapherotrites archaeon]HIH15950.1 DUF357 domain-containing protein [Candidatus Diapherotrites archaeon]